MCCLMPGINLPQLDNKNMPKMLIPMLKLYLITNKLHKLPIWIRLLISHKYLLKSMREWHIFGC